MASASARATARIKQLYILDFLSPLKITIICNNTIATAPDRRGEGLAGALVRHAIEDARAGGRRGVVLTAKPELVGFYARLGFRDEGVSQGSTHGGAVWHQMRLIL